ncbi:MAG TPA: NAD-dependent epimerase/dehydratase family protein [Bacteroidota bacterium]|nr:NAD-dependent epimerase/dehydratase family protein [Bacteroidota bacterium]
MKIKTIIFGATGMVGEGVLMIALNHPDVESVLVISRRPCESQHPKLKKIIHKDFFDYSSIEKELKGYDACFFCLGVTSVGKKEDEYTHLTYDLTMAAARCLSNINPALTFCYVSGTGTDSTEHGSTMWARVKGKTENDLTKLPFKAAYAFRPGFIKPLDGQRHAYGVSKILGKGYPLLRALFPKWVCTLADVGHAMIEVSTYGYERKILENLDLEELGRRNRARLNTSA